MKKFLALILAVLMIAGSVVSVAAFDDVAADSKYATAINELQTQKVVAGKTETTFAPDELVTRWQMALFIARATSGKTDDANWAEGAALFTDCTQYLGAIQYCFTKGIIKGVTTTEFAPNANITLRDGVIMAVRALGYEKADEGKEASAKKYNVTGATYWLPYYQTGSELGLLENLETVAVTKELTRAETAQLIYNMLYTEVYVADADQSYTLNDIAFGGVEIVEVENVTEAYISETPAYFFEDDSIGYDEEAVIVTVDEDNSFEVSFDTLEKAGVDIENIDAYFGARVELINCDTNKDGEIEDYETYETIKIVDTDVVTEVTSEDITVNAADLDEYYYVDDKGTDDQTDDEIVVLGDRIKIKKKTHYTLNDEKSNYIELYAPSAAESGECDDIILYPLVAADLEGMLFDAKLYDVDNDGYAEYGFVYFYNMAEYTEANLRDEATCGIMKGLEVEYSEELAEEDVFVYTFDPFTLTVDVKEVIEAFEGTIKGYSKKVVKENGETREIGYVKIDDETYTIAPEAPASYFLTCESGTLLEGLDVNDVAKVTADNLKKTAMSNVGGTFTYYLFNGNILAFGEEAEEAADEIKYAVVKDFTDFELYEYVVLAAYVDGEEKEIKVNKVQYQDAEGWVTKKVEKLGYKALTTLLNDIEGIYTYTVDEDGYYAIKEQGLKYRLGDYLKVTNGQLTFKDYNEVEPAAGWNARGDILRVNSSTKIYQIDGTEVTPVDAKYGKEWYLDGVTEDSMFYVDRLGFGDPEAECTDRPNYGVASIVYIQTSGEVVSTEGYKLVFVDDVLADIEIGTSEEFGLDIEVLEDEEAPTFTKFAVDGEAYGLVDFKAVDVLYAAEGEELVTDLNPGVYLIDANNIVVDFVEINDMADVKTYGLNISDVLTAKFMVAEIAASNIDLYGYNNVCVKTAAGTALSDDGTGVKTVTFKDYISDSEDDAYITVTKSNKDLIKYLDGETVKVVIAANGLTAFSVDKAFAGNTIRGIIIDSLLPQVEA